MQECIMGKHGYLQRLANYISIDNELNGDGIGNAWRSKRGGDIEEDRRFEIDLSISNWDLW